MIRDSGLDLSAQLAVIPMGRSNFGLRAEYIRASERINSEGRTEELSGLFIENNSKKSEAYEYSVESEALLLRPMWSYGLTSSFAIFLSLPIYQTQAESTTMGSSLLMTSESNSSASPEMKEMQTTLGAPLLSTRYEVQLKRQMIAFFQRVRFPTADEDDLVYFTHGSPPAIGFGIGLGAVYRAPVYDLFDFLLSIDGMANLDDEIQIESRAGGVKKSIRTPGQVFSVQAQVAVPLTDQTSIYSGYQQDYKNKDEFKEEASLDKESLYDVSEAKRLLLAYEYKNRDQSVIKLSYSHFLDGLNVTQENSAALEFRVSY